MELDDLHFLLTDEGQHWLEKTADSPITPDTHLHLATQLRHHLTPAQTHAILETALLRQKATAKFSRANQMYFTREALEQASGEVVATYRARRFARAGAAWVADLGCGIGGDALALAAHAQVVGIDEDLLRLAMARQNMAAYGHGTRFHPLQADLTRLAPLPVDAFFFDPARRDERGRRLYAVHDYRPPLDLIDRWLPMVGQGAVKISPGVDYAQVPETAELEFISVNGGVKEGLLWFGDLQSGVARRATLLPEGHTITSAQQTEDIAVTPPRAYLYEPDGAIIRAHLVEAVAQQLDASKIDDEIAYLTADSPRPTTPFARCFALEAKFPFQLKRLRHFLRQQDIGRVTVKKRGSPLEPQQLQRQLRLSGEGEHRILFLTHVAGKPFVLVGQEIKEDV